MNQANHPDKARPGLPRWLVTAGPPAALIVLLLLLWQAFSSLGGIQGWLLPSPLDVLAAGVDAWLYRGLPGHTGQTLAEAVLGFLLAVVTGLGLALLVDFSALLRRVIYPLLVVSQTIPIIAIAPLIVIGLKADWFGVAIVSTYLTFFPVTIAALRGLRAYDPRALELMRSYAASRGAILRKLRLPAARPYLFTGFRIAAPAAVVGAIVGELPSLIQDGLARQIITGMQYYSLNAEYLWAAIAISSVLGIGVYLLVAGVEAFVLRHERRPDAVGA